MPEPILGSDADEALEQVLGYLNYSHGAQDPQTLRSLDHLGALCRQEGLPFCATLGASLRRRLGELAAQSKAFADAEQADGALRILWDHLFDGYREFHRELLLHLDDDELFRPFFVGRAMEAVLAHDLPWNETQRITEGAIAQLNDFVGYRPVAALESQRIEPYPHEWVRPIPIYVRDAGIESGPVREVLDLAITLLKQTAPNLLRTACFDMSLVDEIAIDPRAYDFDHPANKRPNHHFGMWDPHLIDNSGRYRRFIVQQVTLDALMCRLDEDFAPRDELLFEAASVLAGTMLMSSAVCGQGPGAFESTMTLGHLLPPVAYMRDEFYRRLIASMKGDHAKRLSDEAETFHQPFGGARQHLNAELARSRATQLEHVHLAKLYARMGFLDAADRQAKIVSVASARVHCDLDCLLTTANRLLDDGDLESASKLPMQVLDLLRRGIDCGAVVDPWNILGFDAHFSLFPAMENSIHDHRVDDLVGVIEHAAAVDNVELRQRIDHEFRDFSDWWRKFAAHEVESVDCPDPQAVYHSAKHVADALNLWHKGGAETGNVGFWAPHAELFDSPKGYVLVVDALLQRGDFVSSMALLNHWLGQADRIPLEQGECSFHELSETWIEQLLRNEEPQVIAGRWPMLKKFFDYLEANAEEYWVAPSFELSRGRAAKDADALFEGNADEDDSEENVYDAAYENVIFKDSTNDGEESSVFEFGDNDDEFSREAIRLSQRLAFLGNVARLWKNVAVRGAWQDQPEDETRDTLMRWVRQSVKNRHDLLALMDDVRSHPIPFSNVDHEAMLEYDRRRLTKESLIDRIIGTCVETLDAARLLASAAMDVDICGIPELDDLNGEMLSAVRICSAIFRRRTDVVIDEMQNLFDTLSERPLLYVPLSKGGDPSLIVTARMRQQIIYDLLIWLPRCGLINATCELLETARQMERDVSVGSGAVTEFDELFSAGYRSLVTALANCDLSGEADGKTVLIELLERLTESLLVCWLAHSRTLRLSVLEKAAGDRQWERLVQFIKSYGEELFTQRFLNLGNIRAILHQGVEEWISQVAQFGADDEPTKLLADLDEDKIPLGRVGDSLTLVLEAIIENYGEYRDYNSTTTQSDRGELLYSLLDFLRLRMKYDRIAWNLRPVVWAHDVLVRQGNKEAAADWREALTERVCDESKLHLERLAVLQKQYAMKMPTIADRLAERFVKPLQIDSMRALVPAAIAELRSGGPTPSFDRLEREADSLVTEPTGVGLDAPPWLIALEEEVESATRPTQLAAEDIAELAGFPRVDLAVATAREQLDAACELNDITRITDDEEVALDEIIAELDEAEIESLDFDEFDDEEDDDDDDSVDEPKDS